MFSRNVWNVKFWILTCGYGSSTLFVSPPISLTSRVSISGKNKIFYFVAPAQVKCQVRFNSTLNFSSGQQSQEVMILNKSNKIDGRIVFKSWKVYCCTLIWHTRKSNKNHGRIAFKAWTWKVYCFTLICGWKVKKGLLQQHVTNLDIWGDIF